MSSPETVVDMLARIPEGVPAAQLAAVADAWIGKWSALADEQVATGRLDGRASIYTGETYAQARDRWQAYREALGERDADDDGPCCYGSVTSGGASHEHGCPDDLAAAWSSVEHIVDPWTEGP